jgi:hypothetical protein
VKLDEIRKIEAELREMFRYRDMIVLENLRKVENLNEAILEGLWNWLELEEESKKMIYQSGRK